MIAAPVPAIAVPLTLIAPGPAKVIVRVPAAEAVMPPVMLKEKPKRLALLQATAYPFGLLPIDRQFQQSSKHCHHHVVRKAR